MDAAEIFERIFNASQMLIDDEKDQGASDIAIRLLDALKNGAAAPENRKSVEFLLKEVGLYTYISSPDMTFLDKAITEVHRVKLPHEITLHREQLRILHLLAKGKSIALSAPTAFGKSLLLDAHISRSCPGQVLVIQPTLALIDETRRRLSRNFGETYKIVTTQFQQTGKRNIFVLTPERYLSRNDIPEIDFLFIDEFYKYQSSEEDLRSPNYGLCIYRATAQAKQVFLAGPNITSIDFGPRWNEKIQFEQTSFRTVATDVFDRSEKGSAKSALQSDLVATCGQRNLVYSATPKSCNELALDLSTLPIARASTAAQSLAAWLEEEFTEHWSVPTLLRRGVGIHHGRLPRSIGQLIVRLFNDGHITCLFCTSTLIEGINTAAKNMFIFDKTINGDKELSYFDYQNLQGRAGRMMEHFIGNVYVYFTPPKREEKSVTADALRNPNQADPFVLFNIPKDAVTKEGSERKIEIIAQTKLSPQILRDHGSLGLKRLMAIREAINNILNENRSLLEWLDSPESKEQSDTMAHIICAASNQWLGVKGHFQVSRALRKLHSERGLGLFLRWFTKTLWRNEPGAVDSAFMFLRHCEFTFPKIVRAANDIVLDLEPDLSADYGAYANALESWFRSPLIKHGEELGIPFPITEMAVKNEGVDTLQSLREYIESRNRDGSWETQAERYVCSNVW